MKLCLSLVAAAAVWLALAPTNPAADAPAGKRNDSASEQLGIKLSMQCYTYRQLTFFETVDRAAGLGVKYLEIYPGQKLKAGSDAKTTLPFSPEQAAEMLSTGYATTGKFDDSTRIRVEVAEEYLATGDRESAAALLDKEWRASVPATTDQTLLRRAAVAGERAGVNYQ